MVTRCHISKIRKEGKGGEGWEGRGRVRKKGEGKGNERKGVSSIFSILLLTTGADVISPISDTGAAFSKKILRKLYDNLMNYYTMYADLKTNLR